VGAFVTLELTFRKARKQHRCANANRADRGLEWAKDCTRTIKPGERYAEGESDPYEAGGFGRERFCQSCVDRGLA
jgi:hypothetical protein